jgi:hypothetical protein
MHQEVWRFQYGPQGDKKEFIAACHYLDYDGVTYGPIGLSFYVYYFDGEKVGRKS